MTDAYAIWKWGRHANTAVCTDCHVPHSNPLAKRAFKGKDGMNHSTVFTLRAEPQVLELSPGAALTFNASQKSPYRFSDLLWLINHG